MLRRGGVECAISLMKKKAPNAFKLSTKAASELSTHFHPYLVLRLTRQINTLYSPGRIHSHLARLINKCGKIMTPLPSILFKRRLESRYKKGRRKKKRFTSKSDEDISSKGTNPKKNQEYSFPLT